MKKLRPDSAWAALTPEQRDKLEGWLFGENLSYADALERVKKEFGIVASITSLQRFSQRMAEERRSDTMKSGMDWLLSTPVATNPHERGLMEEAAFKMMSISAYEMWSAGPGKVPIKDLQRITRLILLLKHQATQDARLVLDGKKLEMAASLQQAKATKELTKFVLAQKKQRFPTDEEVKLFNKLNQTVAPDTTKNNGKTP